MSFNLAGARAGRSLVLAGSLLLGSSWGSFASAAEQKAAAAAPAAAVNYVAFAPGEVKKLLPAPPEAGSLADRTDLQTVLQVQAWRTPSDVALAERVAMTDLSVIWPGYSNEAYPTTAKLLGEVFGDLARVLAEAKDLYQRPRPPKAHGDVVKPCLMVSHSFSYPSGHSTVGFVLAGVFGAIVPDKRGETLDRAQMFAWARVIGGVHYPSDTMGGRILAEAFLERLLKNPDFQAKLRACNAELTAAPVGRRTDH